jgi:4-azaleucine resistance transporter AzlC
MPDGDASKRARPGEGVTFDLAGTLEGARRCLPLALSVFAYGLVFGILARQAGLSPAESVLMSALVFAGAAQFVALGLWAAPLPVAAIVLTALVVNLRHLLMGAALAPLLLRVRRSAAYTSVFFMADESWALTVGEQAKGTRNGAFLLGSGLAVFVAWVGATFLGRTVGNVVGDPARWGLDFAFTAVFTALLVGLWGGRSDLLPWVAAAVVATAASTLLPGNWYILLGGLAGSLVGAARRAG